jgi:NADH-quinone oxidoreductase subunit J
LGIEGHWFESNHSEVKKEMLEKLIYEIIGVLIIISAIMVISAKNPIHSILYLILVYVNATALLIMWEVDFIAMILLIVYVGAIAILFLFVIMMLNIKLVEINENQLRYLPIGGIIGVIFLIELLILLEKERVKVNGNIEELNYINWENITKEVSNIKVIGEVMYTEYSYVFILVSVILLVGMIGAIILTEKK